MSERVLKSTRRRIKKDKQLLLNDAFRDIYKAPFKTRFNIAYRILFKR